MHSHHSHSGSFCRHAKDGLEEVVQEAIKQGFETYGLSEHCPRYDIAHLYPEEAGLTLRDLLSTFEAYLIEAVRLKRVYASQIKLLIGLETECIRPQVDLPAMQALIAEQSDVLDYVVGSVHHVREIPIDFDLPTFERAVSACGSIRHLQIDYFDAQYELLRVLKPEVVGHFDLCRLFTPDSRLDEDERVWAAVQRNVAFAVGYGALFEVNAAALRKGWSTPYPGEEVLKLIQKSGGKFCLSDDSHGVERVGNHYAETKAYLEQIGVDTLYYLEARGEGQRAEVRTVEVDWRAHAFWAKCK